MTDVAKHEIEQNIKDVQANIADACARANRSPADVTLVAVSKQKPFQAVLDAITAGVQHFGENRVEEAQEKIPLVNEQVASKPTWHMVGHIQSRKAKHISPLFDVVQSLDSTKLARKLSKISLQHNGIIDVMLEVNISGEDAKYGFEAYDWQNQATIRQALWADVREVVALPGLRVRGLMTMAPFVDDVEQTRPVFAALAHLRDVLSEEISLSLPDLSMGMTNDYPVAVEEGATIVRIGRAIFGPRNQ